MGYPEGWLRTAYTGMLLRASANSRGPKPRVLLIAALRPWRQQAIGTVSMSGTWRDLGQRRHGEIDAPAPIDVQG